MLFRSQDNTKLRMQRISGLTGKKVYFAILQPAGCCWPDNGLTTDIKKPDIRPDNISSKSGWSRFLLDYPAGYRTSGSSKGWISGNSISGALLHDKTLQYIIKGNDMLQKEKPEFLFRQVCSRKRHREILVIRETP